MHRTWLCHVVIHVYCSCLPQTDSLDHQADSGQVISHRGTHRGSNGTDEKGPVRSCGRIRAATRSLNVLSNGYELFTHTRSKFRTACGSDIYRES